MKLRTQLLVGYVLVFFLMIVTAGVSLQNSRLLLDTQNRVDHAQEIILNAHLVQKSLVEMQTGKRGYVITGEESYLGPFEEGQKAYERQMQQLPSSSRTFGPKNGYSTRYRSFYTGS